MVYPLLEALSANASESIKKYMKLSKKSAVKFIGLQLAIIITTLITQMAMVFFAQNKILVIVPKNDQKSFYGLYAEAKTDYLTCSEQLEEMKKAREEMNADIMQ